MKLLHTSDWHVGKALRGSSRIDEHRAVLGEIVSIARDEAVDVVLVVGDVFETAVPTPEAQALVWQTFLDLRATGAHVVVVAGNHDNPSAFGAIRPVFDHAGISVLGHAARPDTGGVVELTTSSGELVRVALLPFCSQRYVVKASELLEQEAFQHAGGYAARMAQLIGALSAGFEPDAVNVFATHCMVRGGKLGGGERDAQTVEDYYVDATSFPVGAHYVALGHLHLTQRLAGPCPIWYSGSPIQVDFGEEGDAKHVLVVEATPTTPAQVRQVALQSPRRLRTLRGSLDELRAVAGTTGDDVLRVYVREQARVGLADEVRQLFPTAVDVYVESDRPERSTEPSLVRSRGPRELFAAYLESEGVDDDRLRGLFARLLDDATAGAEA